MEVSTRRDLPHVGGPCGDSAAQRPFDGYDVVSNVDHPHALERLLHRLDYRPCHGTWSHPDGRIPVVLGGAVDRRGERRACAPMLREMVDSGSALMTLGPEELAELERHVARRRRRVLVHAGAGPVEDDVSAEADSELGDWFRSVPLWLDLPGLRVVHGCWSDPDVELLRNALDGNCLVDDERFDMVISSPRHRRAVRTLLSGATVDVRPGEPMPGSGDGPVVIARSAGVTGPVLLSPTVLCLGEAARGVTGPVAYRWNGETRLDAANLVRPD